MHYRISFIFVTFISLFCFALPGVAQDANTDESKPVIMYSGTPKKYEIADIKVEGVKNYEDYVLIGLSGLSVGQTITVPGDEITGAIKRYWRHGLFSNVSITAEKIEGNKIWLKITLAQRPRISDIRYHGVKKSEREDLQTKLGMIKGSQITPNLIDRAKVLSKRYFDDKGFKNAEITITQRDDPANENQVLVDIDIDKKENEYYIADLIGMEVFTEEGHFGIVKDVMETGANEVYIIDSDVHGEVLVPAIKQCIENVDVENGKMQIRLLEGLIG